MAIAGATALEMMSEPLSLLVLMGALSVSTFAPAFHYHQFGEATRMARDAGLSSLLVAGVLFVSFGTLRSIRREIETGTASVALAISVSRRTFFLSKCLGALAAYAVFALAVAANSCTVVTGAKIGGELAESTGGIARLWPTSYALAAAAVWLPVMLAAALNRFVRFRFCLTAFVTTVAVCLLFAVYRFDGAVAFRLAPVWAVEALVPALALAAAAAFAVRFRTAVAAWAVTGVMAATVPFIGNHCLSDALSNGGSVGWGYAALALAATLPAFAAFLVLGTGFINSRDMS